MKLARWNLALIAAIALLMIMPVRAADKRAAQLVPLSERVAILHESYPDLIYSVHRNTMRLISNRTLIIDDERGKDHLAKIRGGDIEDQLSQAYPIGKCFGGRSPRGIDPGRIRSEQFFRLAYGRNEHQVKQNTVAIDWFGTTIRFSRLHGAAEALIRVRNMLMQMPSEYHAAVRNPETALEWRNVEGTERLDVHSFGIAIDINPEFANRWRGSRAQVGRMRRFENKVPPVVVDVFERNGFIWGGKWNHYNLTHFEYRPEMIEIGRRAEARGCEKIIIKAKRAKSALKQSERPKLR